MTVSGSGGDPGRRQPPVASLRNRPRKRRKFSSWVLIGTAEATWAQVLPEQTNTNGRTQSWCSFAMRRAPVAAPAAAMGPFYCPNDEKITASTSRSTMSTRSLRGAGGSPNACDHARSAHVQHLLGTDAKVRAAQEQNPRQANALSVALELQADCYSGIWANHTQQQVLDPGDIEQGMNAAAAVGDDRIQKATTGHVNVDSFTHGSSTERASWFRKGFASGNLKDCNTFAGM